MKHLSHTWCIFSIVASLFITTGSLQAQLHTFAHDRFDDTRYGWDLVNEETLTATIDDGKFFIEKSGTGGSVLTIHRFIEETDDFLLEADFMHTEVAENKGAGLVWGHSADTYNDNYFAFSSDGYFLIQTDGKPIREVNEWTKTDHVKPVGSVNKLRIEQRTQRLYFYINDSLVHQTAPLPWFGTEFGVITFAREKLIVDNFRLLSATKIRLPAALERGLKKENLGPNINTRYAEIHPIISADGRTLYFARKRSPENTGGRNDKQDIYYAVWEPSTEKWSKSRNMGNTVNTTRADNLTAMSADNNRMVFYDGGEKNKGGFLVRERTKSGWSSAIPLKIEIESESDFIESCISADGQAILFTAKNRNNILYQKETDERDIYVCLKRKNESWGRPVNLGAKLNTPGDEYSPFLAADGRTLYFATNGRPGYGRVDIFMAKRLGDDWTDWTEPVNLGPEINTAGFDAYYTVPASGNYAYMVSDQAGYGDIDIVRVKMSAVLKPDPVVLIKGRTWNAKSKKPVSAAIIVEDLNTQQQSGEAISNPATGEYRIVLPVGKNVGFHAYANGFLSVSENLDLTEIQPYAEKEKDLFLIPITVGETLPLNNVFFEQGNAVLKRESFPELDRLVKMLKDNPSMEIELTGHTDNVGSPASLVALSQERVATVKKYLTDKGIQARRITGKGYGAEKPVAKNDTEENKKKNRRVEFRIIKL